jgi:hypothetical protein
MKTFGRWLAVGAAGHAMIATDAPAGTWKVGRNATDCPGGCHFHDGTIGGGVGEGIHSAMNSPNVLPGDTVQVWPGDYSRRFEMKSAVTLVSALGPEVTTIRGSSGAVPGVSMSETNSATVVDGFTFRWVAGPASFGGAIGTFAASGTIRNNIFSGSKAGLGAGVYIQVSDVVVENNLFIQNETLSGGGTISISGGTPVIRNNSFHANVIPFGHEGVDLYSVGADFTFERNIMSDAQGGAGIFCAGAQSAQIACNILWNAEFGAFGGTCGDALGTEGNVSADPLFCSPADMDFGLCADSPALGGPCGVVGYVSPGGNCPDCAPTSVSESLEPSSWGRMKARYK